MAVSGKRLFWVSIIIVELVLVYVAWRPVRDHFRRQSHRIAAAPRPQRRAETASPNMAEINPSPAETSSPAPFSKSSPPPKPGNPAPLAKSTAPAPKVGGPAMASKAAQPVQKKAFPANKAIPSTTVIATAKPSPIPRPRPRPRNLAPVVNAGLKTPEPIPAKPSFTSTESSPLDSFWCRISQIQKDCDCKKGEEQAANHVMR